jgi:hypothetical protein
VKKHIAHGDTKESDWFAWPREKVSALGLEPMPIEVNVDRRSHWSLLMADSDSTEHLLVNQKEIRLQDFWDYYDVS